MRRILLLALTIGVAALAMPTASEAYLTGVADQSAAMFVNKYYTQLIARQPASHRISRYILPYDADDGTHANIPYLNEFINWYNHAKADHVQMLVALYHSEQPRKVTQMPSVATYTKDIKRLMSDKRSRRQCLAAVERVQPRPHPARAGQPVAPAVRRVLQGRCAPPARRRPRSTARSSRSTCSTRTTWRRASPTSTRSRPTCAARRARASARCRRRRCGACTTTPTPTASPRSARARCWPRCPARSG